MMSVIFMSPPPVAPNSLIKLEFPPDFPIETVHLVGFTGSNIVPDSGSSFISKTTSEVTISAISTGKWP